MGKRLVFRGNGLRIFLRYEMENCSYCHKPIEGLKEGDVPYHVGCALKAIRKRQQLAKSIEKDEIPQENSDSS